MSESRIVFTQQVTNREMAIYGDTEVRRMVTRAFLHHVRELILEKIELETQVCCLMPEPDYTLSPYKLSQQYGIEYSTSLIVMTPEELAEHDRQLCEACGFDDYARQSFARMEEANC